MRIAVVLNGEQVSSMDDGEVALIFENGKMVENFHLDHRDEHPGLYKLSQILPKNVNAVVTRSCGPPGFRLAMNNNVRLYKAEGRAEDIVRKIENGEIIPAREGEMGHGHHHHHHEE